MLLWCHRDYFPPTLIFLGNHILSSNQLEWCRGNIFKRHPFQVQTKSLRGFTQPVVKRIFSWITPHLSLSKCDILSSHSGVDKYVTYCATPLRFVWNFRRFGGSIYGVLSIKIQKAKLIILIPYIYWEEAYVPLKENAEVLVAATREIGLEVSADKTKYMLMSRDQKSGQIHIVRIDNTTFERVEEFKYLGTTLRNQNSIAEEIKGRLRSGNACYNSV